MASSLLTTEQIEAIGIDNVTTKDLLASILWYMTGGPFGTGDVVTDYFGGRNLQDVGTKHVIFGILQEVSKDIDTDVE